MNDGLIAQSGSPQEMYEFPSSEFVAGFMGEAMLFPGEAGPDGSVKLGPLHITPKQKVASGLVKVAVRPEAWQINRDGSGIAGRLLKRSYLGSFFEYTFDTALGNIFVVSPDLTNVLDIGIDVGLSLADHGVSVVKAT
jgi:iron(III) transport system ATP-binding protein